MSSEPGDVLSLERWHEQEAVLNRFEDAWRHGPRPAIDDYRPAGAADSITLLAELAQTDLEFRLKAGEPARAEEYLARYPELAADTGTALDLLATEYVLRRRQEPDLSAEEYLCRFPQYGGALRARLEDAAGPPVSLPGYEVLGELGRGGMGIVYRARQTGLNRLVALKMVLTPALAGPAGLARFRREAEAAARLHHPNIVQIYEVGEYAGRPYLALEYVKGPTLARRLAGAPAPARDAAGLVEVLARAMHHAHQRGVVHRDLKPANVLLQSKTTTDNTDGTDKKQGPSSSVPSVLSVVNLCPKITDFGLAKLRPAAGQEDLRGFAWYYLWRQCGRLRAALPAHEGGVTGLALARDGKTLATGGADGRIKLWDTAAWQVRATLAGHAGPVRGLAFTPDGARLASGGDDGAVQLWDVARGAPSRLGGFERGVRCLALSADGRWLAAVEDHFYRARVWDLRTGAERPLPEEEHALAFSPDGSALAVATARGFLSLWDPLTGTRRAHWPAEGFDALAFSPDGKILAGGGTEGPIFLYDIRLARPVGRLSGHHGGVRSLAFSADGRSLFSGGDDGTARWWDVEPGRERAVFRGAGGTVAALALTPDAAP